MRARQATFSTIINLSFILLLTVPVWCKTVYVNASMPDDTGGGLTWDTAKKTVAAGLSAAAAGDEVWVAAGVYNGQVTLKAGVMLYGGFPSTGGSWETRSPSANATFLDGTRYFAVVMASSGVLSSTRIDGFTIRNASGAGISCSSASPTISNNVITGNATGGIGCVSSFPVIRCNIIAKNNGSAIRCGASSPTITNNTIVQNVATDGAGVYCNAGSSPVIANNIIAFNTSGIRRYDAASSPVLRNNCVYNPDGFDYYGLIAGPNDVSSDPNMVPGGPNRYHIQPDSPCIDAGDDTAVDTGWLDIDGQQRQQDGNGDGTAIVDIGADESDGGTWPDSSVVICVSKSGNDSNDGSDWAHAKLTIQAGIDAASYYCGEVWVANGDYVERITIKDAVSLYGGFMGSESSRDQRRWLSNRTTIDSSSTGDAVTLYGAVVGRVRADGFTIQGCTKDQSAVNCLGGSPLICNNSITGNQGNGILCSTSTPRIYNNLVVGNGLKGIYCKSAATITNNTIVGNGDSGIYCEYSASEITNNIVAFNATGIAKNNTTATPILQYNCVYNPDAANYSNVTPGASDISSDPKFVSVSYGQVHLLSGSPCIDAGDDSAAQAIPLDIDGDARVLGTHIDMGADEYDGTDRPFAERIIRVSPTGDDANDGSGWTAAKKSIQAAVDAAASSGAEVWVAAGVYKEQVNLRRYVYLYGGFAGTENSLSERNWRTNITVIDGSLTPGSYVVAVGYTGYRTGAVDGFTIRNGGGGIGCAYASLLISNNVITENEGSGISCYHGSPAILSNTISKNKILSGNTVSQGGGIYCDTASPLIMNNCIVGNTASGDGCGIYFHGVCKSLVVNNTIVGNVGRNGGGVCFGRKSASLVLNNIIAFNSSGISGSCTLGNNCVYNPGAADYIGVQPGSGDIQVDPDLTAPAFGQVHLNPSSPCIDAGDVAVPSMEPTDIDGDPRKIGGSVDIGADEFNGSVWPFTPSVIRVKPSGDDANDGSTWDLAKQTVQAAIDAVSESGGEVWVAGGTYKERINLRIFTYVYGGFAGTEVLRNGRDWTSNQTVLDGQGLASVVTSEAGYRASRIDGFTICNGRGTYLGSEGFGGGVLCNQGSPIIANNIITRNTATHGGGIACEEAAPLIVNNVIAGNAASKSHKLGGGIACESALSRRSPVIVNNTVICNSAGMGGGVYCNMAVAALTSNIIAFNSSGVYGSCNLKDDCFYNPDGTDCSIAFPPGAGNFIGDPHLEAAEFGRAHLLADSPCIDAGDDSVVDPTWLDMDGLSRTAGGHVDIGADEFDGTVWSYQPPVVRVSPSGDDANDGSSWALAKRTIQAGADVAAVSGGEVWVAKGLYSELVSLKPFVRLYGGFGGTEAASDQRDWRANQTIIDGGARGSVMTIDYGCRSNGVDGFTIQNGAPNGVYGNISGPLLRHNLVWRNNGKGIWLDSGASGRILNNTITGNSDCGIVIGGTNRSSNPVIANNVISANGGGGVGTLCNGATICNNTIVGNNSTGLNCNGQALVANNIIAFNQDGVTGITDLTMRHNCVYNPDGRNYFSDYPPPKPGVGDISVDPKLASLEFGRLHLQPGSPCIDTGDDSVVESGSADMDGRSREAGSHVDMGADEFDGTEWSAAPRIVRVSPLGDDANDGSSWSQAKKSIQAGIDTAASQGGEVWVSSGEYAEIVKLNAFAHVYGGFAGDERSRSQRNWSTRATTIRGDGQNNVVSVNHGFYVTTIDGFRICDGNRGIAASSASPRIENNTIESDAIGVECLGPNKTLILNNTIRTNGSGGIRGGGSFQIIGNCITGNTARTGAGIAVSDNSTSVLIAGNTIKDNTALDTTPYGGSYGYAAGGGIHCGAVNSVTISNNVIAGNKCVATYGGKAGGGIEISSPYTPVNIVNNTIVGNTADTGGGIRTSGSLIKNNIIAFNSSGIYGSYGSISLQNNDVYNPAGANYAGVLAGVGDISADPMFLNQSAGDYHLASSSVCINAGANGAAGLPDVDFDGQPRVGGGVVDIGADEYWLVTSILEAKQLTHSTTADIKGAVVTAVFPDFFYIESDDRACGIRVDKAAHGMSVGSRANVFGTLQTNADGERFIAAASAFSTGSGGLSPLGTNLSGLGGGDFGYQAGVWGWQLIKDNQGKMIRNWMPVTGLNTIGLLVRIWGRVTSVGQGWFSIDDGSMLNVKCILPQSVQAPAQNSFVCVTGVSSCETVNAEVLRTLRVRAVDDVAALRQYSSNILR